MHLFLPILPFTFMYAPSSVVDRHTSLDTHTHTDTYRRQPRRRCVARKVYGSDTPTGCILYSILIGERERPINDVISAYMFSKCRAAAAACSRDPPRVVPLCDCESSRARFDYLIVHVYMYITRCCCYYVHRLPWGMCVHMHD